MADDAGIKLRALGKDGPQMIRSAGKRWTDRAEACFLDRLAATCNVTAAAEAAGFSTVAIYKQRRADADFADRWRAALDQGYARLETMLLENATATLAGHTPDPASPIPRMTVKEAMGMLALHRASVKGGPHQRYDWRRRPRRIEEVRDSILRKLAAIERAQAAAEAAP